jgi:NitT/TauT family transport system ATP-binding protein
MLEFSNLGHQYASGRGLQPVSFSLALGSSCAIIGRSGSGKTTLLHLIAGILPSKSGMMNLATDAHIGLMQQKDALFPWLSIEDNVRLGYSGAKESSDLLLSQLEIFEFKNSFPGALSAGQRQRAALARALLHAPDILLLDEPSSALDAFTKDKLQRLLLESQQSRGYTSILVTHSIEEALYLGSHIAVLEEGKMISFEENPFFPDPDAKVHKDFYTEIIRYRTMLGAGS